MEASTIYGDLKGTVMADVIDRVYLDDFAKVKGIDTRRYEPIGLDFYSGSTTYNGDKFGTLEFEADLYMAVSFICVDNDLSTDDVPYIVSISNEYLIDYKEFFGFFKRFNMVLTNHIGNKYKDFEIDEEITLSNE